MSYTGSYKQSGVLALVVAIIVVYILGLSFATYSAAKRTAHESRQKYEECKAKTSDLEWCFKNFNPHLE